MVHRSPQRILIVMPNHMGDSILSLSLVHLAKNYYPGVLVDVLAPANFAAILILCPLIHQIIPYDRDQHKTWWKRYQLGKSLSLHGKYDLAICLAQSIRGALIAKPASQYQIGYRRDGYEYLLSHHYTLTQIPKGIHYAETQAYLLSLYAQKPFPKKVFIPFEKPRNSSPNSFSLKKKVEHFLLVLGTKVPSRQIPRNKAVSLVQHLLDSFPKAHFLLIGEQRAASYLQPIAQAFSSHPRFHNYVNKTTLMELAHLCAMSHGMVAVDSGPVHLADALGLPVVSLMGTCLPYEYGPFHKHNSKALVSKRLSCIPCGEEYCPYYTSECLIDIDNVAISQALKDISTS
ncbi:MAG: glycosyltransferase family 9 protein [Cytophagales bacterium]|nr:glycosyltransferase family 9 protein [Cytophagales bacterium]